MDPSHRLLNPRAWELIKACEMIVAFNTNGSAAHSLFSPGSCNVSRDLWVITLHELTLYHEVTLAHCTFSPFCLQPFMSAAPPCVHLRRGRRQPHREDEIVSQLWCCQTASDGCTVSLQTEWQTIWTLLCHCGAWPRTAKPAGEKLSQCYGSLRGCWERNAAGGSVAVLRELRGWLTCR